MRVFSKFRLVLLCTLILLIPLGLWARFYGPGPELFNDFLGGIAYEIFWIFLIAFLFPQVPPGKIAIAVLVATCFLEFLQLWQSPELQALRSTFLGRLILGNTFSWIDFPNYFMGSFLGWLWLRSLFKAFPGSTNP